MEKIIKVFLFCVCVSVWSFTQAAVQSDKFIRIPLHATYVTLEPYVLQDISTMWVSRQINCQLVRMRERVPVLEAARSLKYVSSMVLNIKLRRDITFSDSSPLTAEDVVASFDYMRNKGTEFRNVFDWIESIEAKGKWDIVIKLKKQTPDFITALSAPHYALFKKSFIEQASKDPTLWKKPIGCGGYKIDVNNQKKIVLTPKEKGLPILFTFEPSRQVPIQDVEQYDLIPMEIIGQSKVLDEFHVVEVFDPLQFYFAFNTRLPVWKSKKNRCAVFSRINPENVMKLYGSKSKTADNLVPSGILGYSANKNYMKDIRDKYLDIPAPKRSNFCVSLFAISVEKDYRNEYLHMFKKIYPNAMFKIIDGCSNMNQVIEIQKCDGSVFAMKSNYLDGYEYMQALSSQKSMNPTGYYDFRLAQSIVNSQMKLTAEQKSKKYQNLIEKIDSLCLMYPLFTIPYDTVYVKNDISAPGLGQEPVNEYYLGNIFYKKVNVNNHV